MKTFAAILLILIMHAVVFAEQPRVSKNSSLSNSESLAAEMGRMFQLAQNCQQNMANISVSSTTTLFRNYLVENDVKIIMKQYKHFAAQEKGKLCNRDKIKFYILMNKMAVYIRNSKPLTK
ncbi:MAG: hypothetical protein BMS9Abin31_0974 [Gammaproteobacteria bacterium]|nr:MAG: hypothetical protein BMS9Abin31_0974 [Gammaproteobacteria bacterium]